MIDVSVLIVNWNSQEYLPQCLQSLGASLDGVAHEILIVDNDSHPRPTPVDPAAFPRTRWIQLDRNVGFGRANNIAAEQAQGQYLLILNPDTLAHINRPVTKCLTFLDANPDYGCVGVTVLKPDGSIATDCARRTPTILNSLLFATMLDKILVKIGYRHSLDILEWNHRTDADVQIICGCYMVVPRHVFVELGGFNPNIFLFGEDADLCIRIARTGRRIRYLADASVTHIGSGSTRRCSVREIVACQYAGVLGVINNLHGSRAADTFLLACLILLPPLFITAFIAGLPAHYLFGHTSLLRHSRRFFWAYRWASHRLCESIVSPVAS